MTGVLRRLPVTSLGMGLCAGLAAGLVGGFILAHLGHETPLHAVATDRVATFAMCTGPVDEDMEAVYFLDFLTGDLRAAVVNKNSRTFMAFFQRNVLVDLGVDPGKNPRFMIVTGTANLRRGGGPQPGRSIVYVAEVTSGKVAAYGIPWTANMSNMTQVVRGQFIPMDVTQFRSAVPTAPIGGP